jgi:STE24 endopeptidase
VNRYLCIVITILFCRYLIDLIADWLNVRHVSPELPREFAGFYDQAKYGQSQRYLAESTAFGMVEDTIRTAFIVAFIVIGGFNAVDYEARSLGMGAVPTGLVFAGMLVVAGKILALPFSVYETFVIEGKYGFNRTTAGTFASDVFKSLLVAAVIGGALFAAVVWFFEVKGSAAWIYCWIVVVFFQVLLMVIAPVVIMPMFNRFVPLEEGELKSAIERYARAQDFKMKGVFVMDGSRRSSRTNAFFTGLGRFRRIVLLDTLIQKHTVDELVSIVAHEMGHYKRKHVFKALLRSIILSGLTLFLLSLFIKNEQLFAAFRMEQTSVYASLFLFGFVYIPIAMLIGVVENTLSRTYEYEADAFAVATCGQPASLVSGLKKLSVENLTNLTPHPFKVFLSYSHPPVLERIKRIRALARD